MLLWLLLSLTVCGVGDDDCRVGCASLDDRGDKFGDDGNSGGDCCSDDNGDGETGDEDGDTMK